MSRRSTSRLVRREPAIDRLKALLNPIELINRLQEEVNAYDWEYLDKRWGTTIAITLNLIFIFTRANSATSSYGSDIFLDEPPSYGGIFSSLFSLLSFVLLIFSSANAIYALLRTKSYRLFHADINRVPNCNSARRVRVNASPASSSPLRYFASIVTAEKPEDRAHPDETQQVWELSVWDPEPICLRIAVLFSPGNVAVTWFALPSQSATRKPSLTVAYVMAICFLLSSQGYLLRRFFTQQTKDLTSIYSQVSNEYDIKYVRPNLQKASVRDVGVQTSSHKDGQRISLTTPSATASKSYNPLPVFSVRPNPNYAAHYDPDHVLDSQKQQHHLLHQTQEYTNQLQTQRFITPQLKHTPPTYRSLPATPPDLPSSPSRAPQHSVRKHVSPERLSRHTMGGDGGSLGIYTHAASPLRKAASSNLFRNTHQSQPNSELRRREGSPLKRATHASNSPFEFRDHGH